MKRVLCIWFPNFPLQRFLREQPEHKGKPCVLFKSAQRGAIVVACSREALASRITPGLPLVEAQSLLPSAIYTEHHVDADALTLQTLARQCQRFSPRVGVLTDYGRTCLLMDMTGCNHLFEGDHALARQVTVHFSQEGFFVQVGIANSLGAAWAIACYGYSADSSRCLRSLPVESLRLSPEIVERLHQFNLRRVSQLKKLDRKELPSRFTSALPTRLDQLYGRVPEDFELQRLPEIVRSVWSSEDCCLNLQALRYVLSDLLDELLPQVLARSEAVTRLKIVLQGESKQPLVLEQSFLASGLQSTCHLLDVLMLRLEREHVPASLHTVQVEVTESVTVETRQQTLFTTEDAPTDEAFKKLIDRLSTRLGQERVLVARLQPGPLPEETTAYMPAVESPTKSSHSGNVQTLPTSSRPLKLLAPKLITVRSLAPDGEPISVYWHGKSHQVVRCTNQERIQTSWWSAAGRITRTYYRVESQSGERFWLFRNEQGRWFMHGLFE